MTTPKFTQKHFIAVARTIKGMQKIVVSSADFILSRDVVEAFVVLFTDENAAFDADRFRAACGK